MKKQKYKFLIFFLIISIIGTGLLTPNKAQAQLFEGEIFQTPSAEDLKKVGRVMGAGAGLVGICVAWSKIGGGIQGKIADLGSGFLSNLVSGAVGGSVPTEDSKNKQEQKSQNCLNRMGDYFLSTMKQRLLNRLTQQTVEWIQGDGDPKFLQNPTSFLTDATDAALGDVIEDTKLGDLCSSRLKNQIVVQLEQPVFQDRVSCTITDVLGNAQGSIQDFHDDFRNGSWVAYNEVLKPQNNKWGLELIVQKERFGRQEQQEQAAQYEASVGDGFLSQKRCMQWQKKGSNPVTTASGSSYWTETPDVNENNEHDGVRYTGRTERPAGSEWFCIQSETVTPGSVLGDALGSSLESSFNFINNADDLTTFVTAVTNALVNELTMDLIEGREPGIVGAFTGDDEETNYESNDCSIFEEGSDLRERCESIEDEDGGVIDTANALEEILDQSEEALNDASDAVAIAKEENEGLIELINDLEQCQEETGNVENTNLESLIAQVNERSNTINSIDDDIDNLLTEISNLRNDLSAANNDDDLMDLSSQISILIDQVSNTSSSINDLQLVIANQEEAIAGDLSDCTGTEVNDDEDEDDDNVYNLDIGDSHLLTVNVQHNHDSGGGATVSNPDGNLDSYFWSFESCPGESCPSLSNESGSIEVGDTINIPGPRFTPNAQGNFELLLEIVDVDENSITESLTEEAQ